MRTEGKSILKKFFVCFLLLVLNVPSFPASPQVMVPPGNPTLSSFVTRPGQSVTVLPDGSILLLGGTGKSGALSAAAIGDVRSGLVTSLAHGLNTARAWHTANVLRDGTVLITGGQDSSQHVIAESEIFDPSSKTFRTVESGLLPRAHHAATLLTDGRLLIVGGIGSSGGALTTAEFWDLRHRKATSTDNGLSVGRLDDHSALLADGTVLLWGGTDTEGNRLGYAELYDPQFGRFTGTGIMEATSPDFNLPFVEDSVPEDGATNVAVDTVIAARLSKVLQPATISSHTVTLQSSAGSVAASIVGAEAGRLAFVAPKVPLMPGTQYYFTLEGATDSQGLSLSSKTITFTTAGNSASPVTGNQQNTNASPAPPPSPTPLPGVTAVSGQTLKLDRTPLPNVTLKIANQSVKSDVRGHFVLTNPPVGFQTLIIDGRSATVPRHTYGVFQVGVKVIPGQALKLPHVIWMTELDMVHAVHVPFPTKSEVVITTPTLPGLEFHLPPNTTITDIDGKVANVISITPIPITQPPFPLPHIDVPIYFTIQPGGGKIWINNPDGPQGGRLFYPNLRHLPPGALMDFWNYDPNTSKGWYIYGKGKVSQDGKTVVPNPGVEVYALTGAMVGGPGWGPPNGPPPGCPGGSNCSPPGGDPVDLSTGLFTYQKTDLYLPDTIPISVTRSYRQNDSGVRAFGVGMSISYDMWIEGNLNDFSYVELVQSDGSRMQFTRTQGSGWDGSTLQCISCPGPFFGATFSDATPGLSIPSNWLVLLRDGTLLSFLQPGTFGTTDYQGIGLVSITDRNGNKVQIVRSGAGSSSGTNYITEVISPNGRWIKFSYNNANCPSCITSAQDNSGRVVQYSYNASTNQLQQVIDANNGKWNFGWSPTNLDQMTSLTDARQIQFLTNYYDSNDRVYLQTQADGTKYQFSYTTDAYNNITQTTVTDPNGNVRQVTFATPPNFADGFSSGGYTSTDVQALGKPEQETVTYQSDPNTGLLLSVTDSLNRQTSFGYDAMGNTTSITNLAGTPNAVTTSLTYDPTYGQVTSITDPLGHETTYGYDGKANLLTTTDPLGNQSHYLHDGTGRLISAADPLGNTWRFAYGGADLTSVTDPLGNNSQIIPDGGGRVVAMIDPLGQTTKYQYSPLNQVTQKTDALGGVTILIYDPNGRLQTVTDPRNTQNPTQFSYSTMDRLTTRTDPLGASDAFFYDGNGNLNCHMDRRGLFAIFGYDGINRRTSAGFGAASCTATTFQSSTNHYYDAGNRPTSISDSVSGTITPVYDGIDRLTSVTTPQGSLSYQYDVASRKTQMTVTGQPSVVYTYDNSNRLTQVSQAGRNVTVGYDSAGRRTSLTLPDGLSTTYVYDSDSRLTNLTYHTPTVPSLANLVSSYDQDSRVAQKTGSLARTSLPTAVASAGYDVANRMTSWGSNSAFTYDANGNLQYDGTNNYSWDARSQLSSITEGVSASFQYDPLGRRVMKTIAGLTTAFLYDGVNVVQELAVSTPTANLLNGGVDEIFTRTDSSGERSFLHDNQGSTMALADPTATIDTQYTYDAYGNTTTSGSANSNSFQYTGRENDGTGLYYYRARYYSPGFQRLISQDPIGVTPDNPNLYAYNLDSPTNYADPSGRSPFNPFWPIGPINPLDGSQSARVHGNWCGPGWTGGRWQSYSHSDDPGYYQDPVDQADAVCANHDVCYYKCRSNNPCDSGGRQNCMKTCDKTFETDMLAASGDTMQSGSWEMDLPQELAMMAGIGSVSPNPGPNGGPGGSGSCNPGRK